MREKGEAEQGMLSELLLLRHARIAYYYGEKGDDGNGLGLEGVGRERA